MEQRFQVIQGRKAKENDREQPEIRELPPFEEALLGHLDGLFGLALRLANGQRGSAEDLVQEASMRPFKS